MNDITLYPWADLNFFEHIIGTIGLFCLRLLFELANLVGWFYDILLEIPKVMIAFLDSDLISASVNAIRGLGISIVTLLFVIVIIRVILNYTNVFESLKRLFIVGLIFIMLPGIQSFSVSLMDAGITVLPKTLQAGETTECTETPGRCFAYDFLNSNTTISPELIKIKPENTGYWTPTGNPEGKNYAVPWGSGVGQCSFSDSFVDCNMYGDKAGGTESGSATYGILNLTNVIVLFLIILLLIVLMGFSAFKIMMNVSEIILFQIFGSVFVMFGVADFTKDYLTNYFKGFVKSLVGLMMQVYSISFGAWFITGMMNAKDAYILTHPGGVLDNPISDLIFTSVIMIGGITVMVDGSNFFKTMLDHDTGVSSAMQGLVAFKIAQNGINGGKAMAGGIKGGQEAMKSFSQGKKDSKGGNEGSDSNNRNVPGTNKDKNVPQGSGINEGSTQGSGINEGSTQGSGINDGSSGLNKTLDNDSRNSIGLSEEKPDRDFSDEKNNPNNKKPSINPYKKPEKEIKQNNKNRFAYAVGKTTGKSINKMKVSKPKGE